ncbi:MAG TPA: hypothetical protein PLR12_04280, partial [Clostridia bacterium]|nr:hypothetical protein [Clostridia bacterium]
MSNTPGKSSKVLSIVLALALVAAVAFGVITNQQKADLEKKAADLGIQVTSLEGELATAKTAAEEAQKKLEEATAQVGETVEGAVEEVVEGVTEEVPAETPASGGGAAP